MLVATWNETISKFWQEDGRTPIARQKRLCPRDLEPSCKWKCKQWKTTDHYFFEGAGVGVKGLENFHMQTVLLCFRLPANTFLIPYNLLQCIQPLQTIYFTIFQPRPPNPVKKIMVRSLPLLICILYLYANFSTISHLLFLKWVQEVSEQPRPQGAFPPIKPGKSALGTRLVSER